MLAGLAAGLGELLTANPCGAVDLNCRLSGRSWPGGLAGDRACFNVMNGLPITAAVSEVLALLELSLLKGAAN